jgi:outer membrane protein OmpA-like peptidoglycan-associated protein
MLLRSLLYRVRDVFLIHRATGVLLLHRGRAATVRDPQLVPAMLTAIQDFVRDSFTGLAPAAGGAADLETIQAGEFTLWIQHGPQAVLAGVVEGVAPRQLRTVFQEANEEFHREYAGALERFDGDPGPLEPAEPILDRCLLGQANPGERKRGSGVWRWTAAGVAAAALVAAAIWLGAARWRFEKLVDQVRREEGVLVTASGVAGWNRYFVEGLKDPLSADLGRYQATSGLDARQVEWRWRPYASLEPGLVARREILAAVDQLAALELRYDRAKTDPPALELDQAAQAIRRLAAASEQARRFWRVTVEGAADELGDPGVNRRIAEERAGRVRTELVARGIPPDRITTRVTMGGKRRRVSFEAVRL